MADSSAAMDLFSGRRRPEAPVRPAEPPTAEMNETTPAYETTPSLARRDSLRVKLAALFILIFILVAAVAWSANRVLVQGPLGEEAFRYQSDSAQAHAAQIGQWLSTARDIAVALGSVHEIPAAQTAVLGAMGEAMGDGPVLSAGLWPQPARDDESIPRRSAYWLYRGSGFEARDDYNDTRTVPYWHEAWYTPARYAAAGGCYWTPAYRDPLLNREVLSCATPILRNGRFLGAATTTVDRHQLNARFQAVTQHDEGYSLLLDRENRVLGLSANAETAAGGVLPANVADLAKRVPDLAPMSLALHEDLERLNNAVVRSAHYDAAFVSDLKDSTRGLTRTEAESALLSLWRHHDDVRPQPRRLFFDQDPILKDRVSAYVIEVPESGWRLVRVTASGAGIAGTQGIAGRSLLVNLAVCAILLLLLYGGLERLLVTRLRRVVRHLDGNEPASPGTQPDLRDGVKDEIGVLVHWSNEQRSQLRELSELLQVGRNTLHNETVTRRAAEASLQALETRVAQLLGAVPDAVVVTDVQGRVENVNLAAERFLGGTVREAIGKPFNDVFPLKAEDDGSALANIALRAVISGGDFEYPAPVRLNADADGESLRVHATLLCDRQGRASGVAVVLRGQAASDPVSGPDELDAENDDADSRTACDRQLRRLQEQSRVLARDHALLYVDVDKLQSINATAGFDAGNEALKHLWTVINAQLGPAETAYKLGADQFALVLENRDIRGAVEHAEALQKALGSSPLRWEQKDIQLAVSVGITPFDTNGNPFDIVRRAEDACHAAKVNGGNQVSVFEPSMQRGQTPVDDKLWLQRIDNGLEQDLLHLTTQWIQSTSGQDDAFEILLALEDEEGFWTTAAEFLPVAERHHLGREIDRWALDRTLAALTRRLPQLSHLGFCGINLSSDTLNSPEMIDTIVDTLQNYPDVPAHCLTFEIREEAVADYPASAIRFCETLRGLGCKVAIDRFVGRRGNDLALLRRLPLDYVKLSARQFRNIAEDPVERLVAESVLRLANTLQLRTIVTGVEEPEALPVWKSLGADYLQGFLIAKPTPVIFSTPQQL